jgi:hypothetical protein
MIHIDNGESVRDRLVEADIALLRPTTPNAQNAATPASV